MEYYVHIDGREVFVELEGETVRVDGEALEIELAPDGDARVRSIRVGGRSVRVIPSRNGRGDWSLEVGGRTRRVQVLDTGQEAIRKARKAAGADSGPAALRAPMPGLVVRIEVSEGDVVREGDGVVIVEAMKMENELRAEREARVLAIRIEEGDTVEKDQTLVEFEAIEEEG